MKLNLSHNPIRECGLKYLANALQHNKVNKIFLLILYACLIFNIDINGIDTNSQRTGR